MTAIASAMQQRCRGSAAGFRAASARSAKIEFTVWARSGPSLHPTPWSALRDGATARGIYANVRFHSPATVSYADRPGCVRILCLRRCGASVHATALLQAASVFLQDTHLRSVLLQNQI